MKEILLTALAILVLISVAGCAQSLRFTSSFTEDEQQIFARAHSCAQVKFTGGSDYKMTLWLERYEYGELMETDPELLTFSGADKGRIIFYSDLEEEGSDEEMLNVAVVLGDEPSAAHWAVDLADLNESNVRTHSGIGEFTAVDGSDIVLNYEGLGTPAVSVPWEFFSDHEDYLDAIAEVPIVVLIGCKIEADET